MGGRSMRPDMRFISGESNLERRPDPCNPGSGLGAAACTVMRTPKRTSSGERAKGQVVLLVEDVLDVRTVLADILVREGFGVVEASNGHEAIVYASALPIDA